MCWWSKVNEAPTYVQTLNLLVILFFGLFLFFIIFMAFSLSVLVLINFLFRINKVSFFYRATLAHFLQVCIKLWKLFLLFSINNVPLFPVHVQFIWLSLLFVCIFYSFWGRRKKAKNPWCCEMKRMWFSESVPILFHLQGIHRDLQIIATNSSLMITPTVAREHTVPPEVCASVP